MGNPNSVTDGASEAHAPESSWVQRVPLPEKQILKNALMKKLIGCIDPLDQVNRDKPGNWKLWRGKLVSERYWNSLVDAEKLVHEEIEACIAEAEELEPGSRGHIFPQALQ